MLAPHDNLKQSKSHQQQQAAILQKIGHLILSLYL
jgi:hypothetical protein